MEKRPLPFCRALLGAGVWAGTDLTFPRAPHSFNPSPPSSRPGPDLRAGEPWVSRPVPVSVPFLPDRAQPGPRAKAIHGDSQGKSSQEGDGALAPCGAWWSLSQHPPPRHLLLVSLDIQDRPGPGAAETLSPILTLPSTYSGPSLSWETGGPPLSGQPLSPECWQGLHICLLP